MICQKSSEHGSDWLIFFVFSWLLFENDKNSANHLFHFMEFLTDVQQILCQFNLTVRNLIKSLVQILTMLLCALKDPCTLSSKDSMSSLRFLSVYCTLASKIDWRRFFSFLRLTTLSSFSVSSFWMMRISLSISSMAALMPQKNAAWKLWTSSKICSVNLSYTIDNDISSDKIIEIRWQDLRNLINTMDIIGLKKNELFFFLKHVIIIDEVQLDWRNILRPSEFAFKYSSTSHSHLLLQTSSNHLRMLFEIAKKASALSEELTKCSIQKRWRKDLKNFS